MAKDINQSKSWHPFGPCRKKDVSIYSAKGGCFRVIFGGESRAPHWKPNSSNIDASPKHDVHINFYTNTPVDRPLHTPHQSHNTMSFLGGSSAPTGASQTQAIKQQVAQEAAVANARQLVEVLPTTLLFLNLPKGTH